MSIYKIPLPLNILEAARERITLDTQHPTPRLCLIFWRQRLWFNAASDSRTCPTNGQKKSAFCLSTGRRNSLAPLTMFSPCASCTPMSSKSFTGLRSRLRRKNSLSQYQPEWQCWEPDVEWVRQPPQDAITDPDFFLLLPARHDLRTICT